MSFVAIHFMLPVFGWICILHCDGVFCCCCFQNESKWAIDIVGCRQCFYLAIFDVWALLSLSKFLRLCLNRCRKGICFPEFSFSFSHGWKVHFDRSNLLMIIYLPSCNLLPLRNGYHIFHNHGIWFEILCKSKHIFDNHHFNHYIPFSFIVDAY